MSVATTQQFKFTERTNTVNTVKFWNSSPLKECTQILYYREEGVTGTFTSAQFRYSFDGATWSNPQTLTQINVNQIPFNDAEDFHIRVEAVLRARIKRIGVRRGNIAIQLHSHIPEIGFQCYEFVVGVADRVFGFHFSLACDNGYGCQQQ